MSNDAVNWEKKLWKDQPFPDNYVPASFLSSLRKNSNFRPYTYWPLVLAATAITQHISSIFIFIAVFHRLRTRVLDPRVVVWISIFYFMLGYIFWETSDRSRMSTIDQRQTRTKVAKSAILVFLALVALSPVLKTLSEATSSDSIWALSAFLFVLNTLLADFTPESPLEQKQERLPSVLSMNAAVFASVVLASRLHSNLSVFALILFAVQLFALSPIVRRRLQTYAAFPQAALISVTALLAIHLMYQTSPLVGYLLTLSLMFITFVSPGLLVWAQRFKNEIRGAWDVAIPEFS